VHGNAFSLGSWTAANGEILYAFGLSYTDATTGQPSLLGLSTTRSAVNWLWTHPSTDGGSDQVTALMLDSTHRLSLFPPEGGDTPSIVLDPAGISRIDGPIRIAPQGDILMGEFGN
jgi:hypothetical protein